MIQWRKGDVFTVESQVVAHGVNCRGVMGAGIAAQVAQRWPDLLIAYRARCRQRRLELGGFMPYATVPGPDDSGVGWVIYNLATQFEPGADARRWAITTSVGDMIRNAMRYRIQVIGLPMIGCGIGGLAVDDLRACLAPFADAPITLAVYEYVPPSLEAQVNTSLDATGDAIKRRMQLAREADERGTWSPSPGF